MLATTHLGVAIVIEAALGFLGVGVPPPTPTWGNMLADAITALVPQWWLVLFPGLAITVTVLAFNLLGDGIRDTLDPRLSPAVLRLVTGAGRSVPPPRPRPPPPSPPTPPPDTRRGLRPLPNLPRKRVARAEPALEAEHQRGLQPGRS